MEKNGFEFVIREEDIKERARFGGYELLRTDKGIMYRNNAGFHVWAAPYAVGLDGKMTETSLHSVMSLLMGLRRDGEDKDGQGRDISDALSIALECACSWPTVAFADTEKTAADFFGIDTSALPKEKADELALPTAFFFAKRYMDFVTGVAKEALNQEKPAEDTEGARILAEDKADAESAALIAGEIMNSEEDGTGTGAGAEA